MTRTIEQERYERLFRAIGKPVKASFIVCVALSLVIAFAFGVSRAFVAPLFPIDWPRWLVFLVNIVPFGIAIIILPLLAQLFVIRGKTMRAIEALNALGVHEIEAYTAASGLKPPVLANVGKARKWLARGEGYGTRLRTRILMWTGELNAAAETVAAMPVASEADAFYKSLFGQVITFCATGSMDLTESRAAMSRIPPSKARDAAMLDLAFEEARLDLEQGGDYLQRLVDARRQIAVLPRGASIRDRIVASLPASIGPFGVIAALVWLTNYA